MVKINLKIERIKTIFHTLGTKIQFSIQRDRRLPYWVSLLIGVSVCLSAYKVIGHAIHPFTKFGMMMITVVISFIFVELVNKVALLFVKPMSIQNKNSEEKIRDKAMQILLKKALQEELQKFKVGD